MRTPLLDVQAEVSRVLHHDHTQRLCERDQVRHEAVGVLETHATPSPSRLATGHLHGLQDTLDGAIADDVKEQLIVGLQ